MWGWKPSAVERSVEGQACGHLLERVREAVIGADEELRVRYLNGAAERALGRTLPEVAGADLRVLLPGADPEMWEAAGWRLERVPGGWGVFGESPHGGEWVGQVVETQQLAAVGQVAAGVAHEIGAPLTAISVAVEYLLKGEAGKAPGTGRDLEMILSQTQRIARLARSLVDLAKPGDPVLVPIDLNRVVLEGHELMDKQLRRQGVEVLLELEPDLPEMRGDANQLQQVLINLLMNAQRAVQAAGARQKRIEVVTRATSEAHELVVVDWGPGIEEDDLSRIFLPFFSRAGGTGLGLSLARNIVHKHGGSIRAENVGGRGAVFTVRLPRADERGS